MKGPVYTGFFGDRAVNLLDTVLGHNLLQLRSIRLLGHIDAELDTSPDVWMGQEYGRRVPLAEMGAKE